MSYTSPTGMTLNPPPAVPPPTRLGFWGTLPDATLERRFRREYVAADADIFRLVMAAAVAGTAFFVVNDLAQPADLPKLLVVRAAQVAASVAVLWRLGRPIRPTQFDRLAFGWCSLLAASNLTIQLVRPPGHLGHAITTVCIVMLTYGVTGFSLRLQTVVAGLHAAGGLVIAGWLRPAADPGLLRALAVGLVCGNLLGFLTARLLHARARRLFLALAAESELTAALEKTLAEVRTLRGLIRICAWCKHIHADGEWQQVERFVSANSHAEFTHGICPACLADQVRPATASPGSGSCSP